MRVEKEVEESPNFAVSWIKGCLPIIQFSVLRTFAARTMGVFLFSTRESSYRFCIKLKLRYDPIFFSLNAKISCMHLKGLGASA